MTLIGFPGFQSGSVSVTDVYSVCVLCVHSKLHPCR